MNDRASNPIGGRERQRRWHLHPVAQQRPAGLAGDSREGPRAI